MVTKKIKPALELDEKETKVKKTRAAPKKSKVSKNYPEHEIEGLIAVEAYYLAEKRGFEPGNELEDWLKAETLVRTYFI